MTAAAGVPLDGDAIRDLLSAVSDELPDGAAHTLVVVGGSLLAMRGLRESTIDVDSVSVIAPELAAAVRRVADARGLRPDWLNDRARAFVPVGLETAGCEVLIDTGRLRVVAAPPRDVFLMKLRRGLPQDLIDMRAIWPDVAADFPSADAVVREFYEAFPAELEDEYLPDLVVSELAKDGIELPAT